MQQLTQFETSSSSRNFQSMSVLLQQNPALNISHEAYNINVTANHGAQLSAQETLSQLQKFPGAGKPAHLYFHVPLCNYICHFCNYVKKKAAPGPALDAELDEWTDLLLKEARLQLECAPWIRLAKITSVYFGGGTAALFRERHLARFMDFIRTNYQLADDCEISLEGNPDNFVEGLAEQAVQLGFNRFSIGIQSLQNEVLKFTGRGHSAEMALDSIRKISALKLPFNVDYMFGLPYQSPETVAADMKILCDLEVPTITIYRLRNADRAKMGIGNRALWNVDKVRNDIQSRGLFPTTDETYSMREKIVKEFLQAGYFPSPCGWWSKPNVYPDGNIPKVSKSKWENYETMLAYGPGAYGWLSGGENRILQTHNVTDIKGYAKILKETNDLPLAYGRQLEGYQAIAVRLGFAFKANQPIQLDDYKKQFAIDLLRDPVTAPVLGELEKKNFISFAADRKSFRPTLEGETLHEEIISVYLHSRVGSCADPICRR
jgi:oxygen-independent coproporphyrinogen-3 oxidase